MGGQSWFVHVCPLSDLRDCPASLHVLQDWLLVFVATFGALKTRPRDTECGLSLKRLGCIAFLVENTETSTSEKMSGHRWMLVDVSMAIPNQHAVL